MTNTNASGGAWSREQLRTQGLDSKTLPGMTISETSPVEVMVQESMARTKPQYSHEEVYGDYCTLHEYIRAPVDDVFNYAANVFSLEEWTYSMRGLEHIGNNLYRGWEMLAPNTQIYCTVESHPSARVVDYLCAWDQGNELWMRYHIRFLDAQPALNKPGTLMIWNNCRHPNYLRGAQGLPQHILDSQARKDRQWVGDFWGLFYAGHQIEARNLKIIMESRFGIK